MKKRLDPSKPPADMKRCEKCGKPDGYKGWFGPECQCGISLDKAAPTHSIQANPPR